MNLHTLKRDELVKRLRFKCVHSHNGLSHPKCFEQKNMIGERVGFLDIEASNLNAPFGIIYTYCIKELGGKLYSRAVTVEELHNSQYDKPLIKQFIKDATNFERLIVHFGSDRKFDIPMLRSRAELWKLPFPEYKFCYVSDSWAILKNKFKLHSNRLEAACDFFDIPSKQHKLKPKIWLMMITGNRQLMQKAIDYIMKHNVEDVISLEKLWKRIYKYTKLSNTSI